MTEEAKLLYMGILILGMLAIAFWLTSQNVDDDDDQDWW